MSFKILKKLFIFFSNKCKINYENIKFYYLRKIIRNLKKSLIIFKHVNKKHKKCGGKNNVRYSYNLK